MENLTRFQASLISDLTNEFDRLNPKEDKSKPKRFGIDTINNCINEEKAFIESIYAYNRAMKKKLKESFDRMTDEFMAEYEEYFHLIYGKRYSEKIIWNTIDTLFNVEEDKVEDSNELVIVVASNTKPFNRGSDKKDFADGMDYFTIHVTFELIREKITLDSGKGISLNKIKGLRFSNYDYLYKGKDFEYSANSLDGLIQICKQIQQTIVRLVK